MSEAKEQAFSIWNEKNIAVAIVQFAKEVERAGGDFQKTIRLLNGLFQGEETARRTSPLFRNCTIGEWRDAILYGGPQPKGFRFNPEPFQQTLYPTKGEIENEQ